MARIRFVLFMLFLSSLGVKGQQAEKYLSHPLPAGWQEQDAMFQQALPVDDHWWKVFEDVTLDSLIRGGGEAESFGIDGYEPYGHGKGESENYACRILSFLVTRCWVEQTANQWEYRNRTVSVACGVF